MIKFDFSDLSAVLDDVQDDLEGLENYIDRGMELDLRNVVAESYTDIWRTRGAAIDSDWNGNDLVQSGRLRNSLTKPSALVVRRSGNVLTFGTAVPYGKYVNERYRFEGLVPGTEERIAELIEEYMDTRTKLNWN